MSPKTSDEWRDYYAKHRDKINANRRKNRLARAEAEKLKLMNPLNLEERSEGLGSDEIGLAQSGVSGRSTIVNFPAQTNDPRTESTEVAQAAPDAQSEILCVLHKISAQLDSQEIAQAELEEDCTIPQAHNCGEKPNFSGDTQLCNAKFEKKDRIEKSIPRRSLPAYAAGFFIIVFLGFNTFFLVSEQVSLYTSLGYSGMLATLIAVLTEAALVSFSLMASWAKDYLWKFLLYAACSVTAVIVLGVLDSSVKNRALEKVRNSEQVEMLKKQINSLEALEATALGIISSIDAEIYPTKINRLMGQLNSPVSEHGYTYQLGQLRKQLAEVSVGTESVQQEILVMKWQRWGAMLWNILMAAFLGFLLAGQKRESLVKQGFESWRNYIRRPCEA